MTAPRLRKRIPVWLLVVGASLLVWGAVLAYIKLAPKHLPTTGDALLDEYFNVARDDGVIPPDQLPTMQAKRNSDPRFWELAMVTYSLDYPFLGNGMEGQPMYDYERVKADYEESMLQGKRPKSPALLCAHLTRKEYSWQFEYNDAHATQLAARKTKHLSKADRMTAELQLGQDRCAFTDTHHRIERDRLHQELQAIAGDYSFVWYYSAQVEAERSNYDKALAFLQRGNQAQINGWPMFFPLAQYYSAIHTGDSLAKHPRLFVLGQASINASISDLVNLKRLHQRLWREAAKRNDRAAMNELHQCACRIGLTEAPSVVTANVTSGRMLEELATLTSSSTPAQQEVVNRFSLFANLLRTDVTTFYKSSPLSTQALQPQSVFGRLHLRNDYEFSPRLIHKDNLWVEQEYQQKIAPSIEELQKFDFTTMSFQP